MRKFFGDIVGMLYDDAECRFLSWPRVDIGITLIVILVLIALEVFWKIQFKNWTYLISAHGMGWAGYVSKKAFEPKEARHP